MLLAFGRLRREERPGDLETAGGTATVDWLVATIAWLGDYYAKVVTALWAISGKIDGHVLSLTPTASWLKRGDYSFTSSTTLVFSGKYETPN